MEKRKERRSKYEIILIILKTTNKKDGAEKTEIVYKANLNFIRTEKCLESLLEKGFIEKITSGLVVYRITEKGKELIKKIEKLNGYLRE